MYSVGKKHPHAQLLSSSLLKCIQITRKLSYIGLNFEKIKKVSTLNRSILLGARYFLRLQYTYPDADNESVCCVLQFSTTLARCFSRMALYLPNSFCSLQFTLINQILKNPDVFCFADYKYHPVGIDMLKSVPENDNKDVSTW